MRKKKIGEIQETKIPQKKRSIHIVTNRELLPITENINENVMESRGAKGMGIAEIVRFAGYISYNIIYNSC